MHIIIFFTPKLSIKQALNSEQLTLLYQGFRGLSRTGGRGEW